MKDTKQINMIREALSIPPELRIWQHILNKFPIKIEVDKSVLANINKQIQDGKKIEITEELFKNIITLNDFYWKSDKDFII